MRGVRVQTLLSWCKFSLVLVDFFFSFSFPVNFSWFARILAILVHCLYFVWFCFYLFECTGHQSFLPEADVAEWLWLMHSCFMTCPCNLNQLQLCSRYSSDFLMYWGCSAHLLRFHNLDMQMFCSSSLSYPQNLNLRNNSVFSYEHFQHTKIHLVEIKTVAPGILTSSTPGIWITMGMRTCAWETLVFFEQNLNSGLWFA